MSNEFQRENRYIVIKRSDLKKVPVSYRSHLIDPMFSLLAHLPNRQCLVIESDWPEYEPAWSAIEARMSGAAPQPPALGVEPVEPWYYYADCADPDYSCLCNNEADALTEVADHGGSVVRLWNVAPDRHLAPLQAEIERLKYDLGTCELMRDIAYSERDQLKARLSALEDQSVWQPLADDDLAEAEKFINDHTGKAAFFSKDAATLGNYAMHCIREVRASRQLKARCDELEADNIKLAADRARLSAEIESLRPAYKSVLAQLDALSKPAGSERGCHLCRGEGRVGGPAPDEGGGKNCGLCDGTGMEVQS